jgi:DNA-directed RNA polymerase
VDKSKNVAPPPPKHDPRDLHVISEAEMRAHIASHGLAPASKSESDAYVRKNRKRVFAEQFAIASERSGIAEASVDRFINQQLAQFEGYAFTAEGRALWCKRLIPLAEHIERARKFNKADSKRVRKFKREIRRLKSLKIAFAALATLLNSIGNLAGEEKSPALTIKEAMGRALIDRRKRWPIDDIVESGNWLLECCLDALPELVTAPNGVPYIVEGAVAEAAKLAELAMVPVLHPQKDRPKPWTRLRCGPLGTERSRFTASFVRDDRMEIEKAVQVAWAAGTMRPHVDGVNALNDVQWQINPSIVDKAKNDGGHILAKRVQRKYRERKKDFKKRRTNIAIRAPMDASAAYRLWKFYTPGNVDFRGRYYPLTHLNYGNADHIRAMFRFANGKPIGDEGLYWLKVHTANVGDFDKISKRTFDERVAWVDAHVNDVSWKEADKPLLFYAAREELNKALEGGPNFITTLPVAFDGSCNGLQHLAAMSRAEEEGALVNLTPSEVPQDIYQKIADIVRDRLEGEHGAHAEICRGWPIERGLLKRPVMTFGYSVTLNGIYEQLWEWLEAERVISLNGHSVRYLAELIFETIKNTVHLPAEVMDFLRECAAAPLKCWTTPSGWPWLNDYRVEKYMTLELKLQGKRRQHTLLIGHGDKFDVRAAKNGVAPNFVHALDASHLMRTVNACVAEGITSIASVHDSYACLAPDASRFNEIIRAEFVRMYEEHDVLAEIRDCSKRKPDLPAPGSLDLRALNSRYMFG